MFSDIKIGTTIKFNSWNDQANVGVIDNNENGLYKVLVNGRIKNIFVNPNQIIGIVDKSVKNLPINEIILDDVIEAPVIYKVIEAPVFSKVIKAPVIDKVIEAPVIERIIEKPIIEPQKPFFQGIYADGGTADGEYTEELPNELSILITKYDDEGTRIIESDIENRIMQVTNFMKKHFGRFTMKNISNSHIDTKDNFSIKSSIIITSYPSDEEFYSNIVKFINFLSVCAEDWGVKEINLEYEGDEYFIPTDDKMKQGGNFWIQDAVGKMKKKGTFGAFTKQAKREGLTPIEFTKKVLENPKGYTLKTRRRANFVKNMNQNKF